jgi:hypothetical protein
MKHLVLAGILTAATLSIAAAQQPAGQEESKRPAAERQAADVTAPTGEFALGSVRIGRQVMADGKPLRAGTYRVRLTAEEAKPEVPGQIPELNRWVEFLQGGEVKGREVVSIVPQSEIRQVADDAPPRPGGHKVQMLKGNEYLRIWINRGGNHYLIHLPPA